MGTLLTPNSNLTATLERVALESLSARLRSDRNYRADEIEEVSSICHKIIPEDVELPQEAVERLRSLIKLYRPDMKRAHEITSHRPIIGKLIVFVKRLSWPFIHAQFRDTFEALEEFHLRVIESLALEMVTNQRLLKQVGLR